MLIAFQRLPCVMKKFDFESHAVTFLMLVLGEFQVNN